jgi:hypothetical protein
MRRRCVMIVLVTLSEEKAAVACLNLNYPPFARGTEENQPTSKLAQL